MKHGTKIAVSSMPGHDADTYTVTNAHIQKLPIM